MAMVPGRLAVLPPESATWIVKEKLPALVGVPETDPLGPRNRPPGSAPVLRLHW
jgi:hypothetical protein